MITLKKSLVLVAACALMSLPSVQAGQARAALENAEHNKGGHRERAIELVEKAIEEVEAGMAFAR